MKREAEHVLVRQRFRLHGEIAMSDGARHIGGEVQVCGHMVQGVDEVLDFVVACGLDVLFEIAASDCIGQLTAR